MDKLHWTVVPVFLAAGWLALAAATLVTLDDMSTLATPEAAAEQAPQAMVECEPIIVVGMLP